MPTEFSLERDNRIIHFRLVDPLDLRELGTLLEKLRRDVLDTSPLVVHNLVDCTSLMHMPDSALTESLKLVRLATHPMMGGVFVVTSNGFIRNLIGTVSRIVRGNFTVYATLEEALRAIEQVIAEESMKG